MIYTFTTLSKILLKKHRTMFIFIFILMIIGSILDVVGIGMIPIYINTISNPNIIFKYKYFNNILLFLRINSPKKLVYFGGILLSTIFFIKAVFVITLEKIKSQYVFDCYKYVSTKLFEKYIYSPYNFHLTRNSAELIRTSTSNTYEFANNILVSFLNLLTQYVTIFSIFILLLVYEPYLTIVTIIFLSIFSVIYLLIIKKNLNFYGKISSLINTKIIQTVNEGLGGIKEATVMNRRDFFLIKFNKLFDELKKSNVFINTINQISKPIVEFISVSGIMAISFTMLWNEREISEIIPILTLFAAAAFKLMPAVSQVMSNSSQLKYYKYALININSDLSENLNSSKKNINYLHDFKINNQIEFSNVFFKYPGIQEYTLKNVNITIKKGSVVAFVGSSGAGKSTLVDLLLGLHHSESGQILVDGDDIFNFIGSWHNSIGYIPQHIFLADDTIKNNIAFGIPDNQISEEKLKVAIESSQLMDYVNTLELGINTVVGERGVRLSGGQRQRIGIARALYNNPQVLIMDEGTSALDNITEKQIINSIESLKGSRTIIMIAHRLTTVENCDKLFYFENGELLIEGSYNELSLNKHFKNMVEGALNDNLVNL